MKKLSYIMCLTLLFTTFGNVQKSSAFDWAKFQRTIDSYCYEFLEMHAENRNYSATHRLCEYTGTDSSNAFARYLSGNDDESSFMRCVKATEKLCAKHID